MLEEEIYVEKINAMSKYDWRPLLELIPEIEATENFGHLIIDKKTKDGSIVFPFCDEASVVYRFQEIVYHLPIMIVFDWGSWEEKNTMIKDENFDFNSF